MGLDFHPSPDGSHTLASLSDGRPPVQLSTQGGPRPGNEEIFPSARKHGVSDGDIEHAVEHALVVADRDQDVDKVLYPGPDRAGNLQAS